MITFWFSIFNIIHFSDHTAHTAHTCTQAHTHTQHTTTKSNWVCSIVSLVHAHKGSHLSIIRSKSLSVCDYWEFLIIFCDLEYVSESSRLSQEVQKLTRRENVLRISCTLLFWPRGDLSPSPIQLQKGISTILRKFRTDSK